jgi:hypothetical protein
MAQLRASSEEGLKEEAAYLKMLQDVFGSVGSTAGSTTSAAAAKAPAVGGDGLTDEAWVASIKLARTSRLKSYYAAALAVLVAYGVVGYFWLPASRFLPATTAAVIVVVDALVFCLVAMGLYIHPPVVVFLLTGIRLALCSFGIRYWFLGHSIVFFAFGAYLSVVLLNEFFPRDREEQGRPGQSKAGTVAPDTDTTPTDTAAGGDTAGSATVSSGSADGSGLGSGAGDDAGSAAGDDVSKTSPNAISPPESPNTASNQAFGSKKSSKHGLLLVGFTVLFVADLVAVALFEKTLGLQTIGISENYRIHPQWLAGLGAIVALISVPLAFLTLRYYQVSLPLEEERSD